MRRPAKPFTVEIKKSRKSSAEPQPLFGTMLEAHAAGFEEAPPMVAERGADRLFSSPAESDALALADQVFGAAQAGRPATRILPDLTAQPPAMPEEPRRQRVERVRPSPKPKAVRPKPIPIEIVPRVVAARKVEPLPQRAVRVRIRRDDGDVLPRGERWKRRLTPFAR
jgi:hypothetical protein